MLFCSSRLCNGVCVIIVILCTGLIGYDSRRTHTHTHSSERLQGASLALQCACVCAFVSVCASALCSRSCARLYVCSRAAHCRPLCARATRRSVGFIAFGSRARTQTATRRSLANAQSVTRWCGRRHAFPCRRKAAVSSCPTRVYERAHTPTDFASSIHSTHTQ